MTMTKTASAIAAIAVLLTGSALATNADAQSWRRGNDRGGWNRGGDWNRRHHDRGNDLAAAAVIAGVAGLVLGSALASDRDRPPPPYYQEPVEDPCAFQDCGAAQPYDEAYADPYNDGYADQGYAEADADDDGYDPE